MANAAAMTLAEEVHRNLLLAGLTTDPAMATIRSWNTIQFERARHLETTQVRRAITRWATTHG
jgi:hypothetical protein